jgi:hypothetical protein
LLKLEFLNPTWFKVRVSGFDWVTGLPGSIFFLKSKRRRFSKKNQWVATGFLIGSCWVNLPGHFEFLLSLFFLQPGLIPAPG